MLTAVLAELRADELVRADIGDIRPTDEGGVIHVHGKGNKERRIPVEQALIHELEAYLESRADRFPNSTKRGPRSGGLAAWPDTAPLFVGRRRPLVCQRVGFGRQHLEDVDRGGVDDLASGLEQRRSRR
jgi:integrase